MMRVRRIYPPPCLWHESVSNLGFLGLFWLLGVLGHFWPPGLASWASGSPGCGPLGFWGSRLWSGGYSFRAAQSPHENFRVGPRDLFGPFFDHFFWIAFLPPKLATWSPKWPKVTPKGSQK